MEDSNIKNTLWNEEEVTAGPNITEMVESSPSLTVATIVGVTVVVLIAITAVFLLGVLIDCRQQKMLEKKLGQVKRLKNHRRINTDLVSIADNMEPPDLSAPPLPPPPAHTWLQDNLGER